MSTTDGSKRKRKRESDTNTSSSFKRIKLSINTITQNQHSIIEEIKSWINDETSQIKLCNAQKSCVFISTDTTLSSGICIDPTGIILTAKHCISNNIIISFPDKFGKQNDSYTHCKPIAISNKYDLALIQIQPNEDDDIKQQKHSQVTKFPFTNIATKAVQKNDSIYIIGHPASSKRLKQKNTKLQQNICGGKIKSLPKNKSSLKEQNIMGAIKHNCVTFAGHSGAPLLNLNGEIIGVHVTCDNFEGTAITQQAIQQFINDSNIGKIRETN